MTPLLFVNGILLGTAFSIFFGLSVVALLLFMLGTDTPQVSGEIKPLLAYIAIFLVLTVSSGLGFVGLVKKHDYRWWAQCVMWVCWIGAVAWLLINR
ncbi:MAG: hypothetical protein HKN70_07020 [Gammaproteobacteria bacterium]|nr:hypothetical protein [Gammaproteobacteria bacterium]